MNKNLSKEEILHLSKLANLSLTDSEIEKYSKQLQETLKYIDNLKELDTSKSQPTSNVTGLQNVFFEDGEKNTRALSQEEALKNGKKTKNGMFVVRRIL